MIALLTRFKIGPRLAASFLALLLAMGALCALALSGLHELAAQLRFIRDDRLPKVERLVSVADNVNIVARQTRNILLFDDAAKRADWLASIEKARADSAALWALVDPSIRSSEGRKMVAKAMRLGQAFDASLTAFIGHIKAGEISEARELLQTGLRDSQLAYMKQVDAIKSFEIARIGKTADEADQLFQRSRALVLSGGIALLLLGALLCWVITRSIVAPLRRAVRDAKRIAAGDLSIPVKTRGGDEAAEMLKALGEMQQGLRNIVQQVHEGVASVATASQQIAEGNQDLSARTEEQAASLQQTAASVEQISGNVRGGAEHASEASELAGRARSVAERGGALVERAVGQIGQLEASSQRIADIVGVIDGIAFQTNLLALNAAVEAARAGDQGRGFAVVASEVRALAGRSSAAAKEIKTLIAASVAQVQRGSQVANAAGGAIGQIVAKAQQIDALMREIDGSSQAQRSGVSEVGTAVEELEQSTQQNAAMVEQTSASANSLADQAERLAASVRFFQLA